MWCGDGRTPLDCCRPFRLAVSQSRSHGSVPHPARRTRRVRLRHPALGQGIKPLPTQSTASAPANGSVPRLVILAELLGDASATCEPLVEPLRDHRSIGGDSSAGIIGVRAFASARTSARAAGSTNIRHLIDRASPGAAFRCKGISRIEPVSSTGYCQHLEAMVIKSVRPARGDSYEHAFRKCGTPLRAIAMACSKPFAASGMLSRPSPYFSQGGSACGDNPHDHHVRRGSRYSLAGMQERKRQ
jgi:hypothetical protein